MSQSEIERESAAMRPYYTTATDLGIVLEPERALLSRQAFDLLLEYSLTLPTGKYLGKVWKRKKSEDEWVLGEYVADPDPKMVGIVWREIVLI